MQGRRWQGPRINCPLSDEGPFADEVVIGAVGMWEKQEILYLFDFGDEWCFKVALEKIIEGKAPLAEPVVVASHGEAPCQYNEY
jgi:hypothetical protein